MSDDPYFTLFPRRSVLDHVLRWLPLFIAWGSGICLGWALRGFTL
jgi:hypothetical protein